MAKKLGNTAVRTLNDSQLAYGVSKCMDNAQQYFEEAKLLETNAYYRRACALAILGIEEIGKIMLLGNTAAFKLEDTEEWNKFWEHFRNHEAKQANAIFYTLFFVHQNRGPEKMTEVINPKDLKETEYSVLEIQKLKNECLYVGFDYKEKDFKRKFIPKN